MLTLFEDSLGAEWFTEGFHLLLIRCPCFCSHLGIPEYLWQRDGCFLIALHINFPSWQSHGKDWLNLNCYYRVVMGPVMQKLMDVSQGRRMLKVWQRQNSGWLSMVSWRSPKHALDLAGSALPDPDTWDEAWQLVCPYYVRGQSYCQLRLRPGQAASYTPHRGESEHCCHPSQPIRSTGHKSAWRPGSSGSGKMECDGLVFTNSRGAPILHHASHHSLRSRVLAFSPQHLVQSHQVTPFPDSSLAAPHTTQAHPLCFSSFCPPLSSHQHCCLTYIGVIKWILHSENSCSRFCRSDQNSFPLPVKY